VRIIIVLSVFVFQGIPGIVVSTLLRR